MATMISPLREDSPLTAIRGIGPKTAEAFERADIHCVGDLLRYYPHRYDVCRPCREVASLTAQDEGSVEAVCVELTRPLQVRRVRALSIITGTLRERLPGARERTGERAEIPVIWYNMPYLRSSLRAGVTCVLRGRLTVRGKKLTLQQPQVFTPEEYREKMQVMQPVYPLVHGLTRGAIVKALRAALESPAAPDRAAEFAPEHLPDSAASNPSANLMAEYLPTQVREQYGLVGLREALTGIHFPGGEDELQRARRRLVFDEFLFFTLSIRLARAGQAAQRRGRASAPAEATQVLLRALPYELTDAQKRVWAEIGADLASPYRMARLVQGDVGSGKTILAFLALTQVAAGGKQGALMAPTEVLARQHYEAYTSLMEKSGLPYRAVLLTGSLSAAGKRKARAAAADGTADLVIGTQALFQEQVAFHDLGLVVTDEQHRFGVRQREELSEKGDAPDVLVMSATPIPRTLAAILYADLDISRVDAMPEGRQKIRTAVVDSAWRPKAWDFLHKEIEKGHQAYVICPMVEESEGMEAENVTDYAISLREALPDVKVALLHGRMKPKEKTAVMERFARGETDILVSTTVIEVGINVPNATAILIENAERFGLAQLHQLRGRVGRGSDQAWCILMYAGRGDGVKERLDAVASTADGFEIAQKDLELRGPGELTGVRQSGDFAFAIGDIYADADTLRQAAEAAQLLEEPVMSALPEVSGVRKELQRRAERSGAGSVPGL